MPPINARGAESYAVVITTMLARGNVVLIVKGSRKEVNDMAVINSQCMKECKKYLGLPPYNDDGNVIRSDGYFYMYLIRKYGEWEVRKTIRFLKGE